jgi:CheY-like chemotaxis protein
MTARTIRILIVDDDPADAEIIQELLEECATVVEIHAVHDGIDALDYLHSCTHEPVVGLPDLILLDLNMPRKDGREVLQEIRATEQLLHLPVIILTTSQEEDEIEQAYRLGANCYVSKPAAMADFERLVNAIELFWMQTASLPQSR